MTPNKHKSGNEKSGTKPKKKNPLSLFVPKKKNKENKKTLESVSAEVLQKNVPICLAFLVEWCVELKS